jgi:hypothetical protein
MTQEELKALLVEVGNELSPYLQSLTKAEEEKPADEKSASASAAPPGATSDPLDGSSVAPPDAPPPQAAPANAPPAAEAAPAQDQGDDFEAYKAEYAQLPLEELKMHVAAAQAALDEAMGTKDPVGDHGQNETSAPPAGPPPDMGMQKSEVNELLEALKKSHQEELEALKGQFAEMQKNTITALEALASPKPVRKAETMVKPEVLAKAEPIPTAKEPAKVKARLSKVVRRNDLTKSDREAINRYFYTGDNYKQIEGLLK